MFNKLSSARFVFTAIVLVCMAASVQAAENPPPAGQMCAGGTYVIGFDSEGNIVCSGALESDLAKAPEAAGPVDNAVDDACPPGCSSEKVTAAAETATKSAVADQGAAPDGPVITKLKPWSVVFGAREATITIIGSGFNSNSVVMFQGATYTPSVNAAGTELRVTLATRSLAIGKYAIKVSNGPGLETTKRGALEVF